MLLLEAKRLSSFNFYIKFRVHEAKFLLPKCTSLLLQQTSTAKLPAFLQKFSKAKRALWFITSNQRVETFQQHQTTRK